MQVFYNKNLWFAAMALIVALLFFSLRPLNAPTERIIAADGLGYYSYLPAQFIYNDQGFTFSWFDEVFNRHYDNHLFEKPTENFMVAYGDKKINKYYPGQSLLQLPFFFVSHLCAQIFSLPVDGFSLPYQLGMGLAALFYTLLGLFFLSRLLFKMFNNQPLAMAVPILIFFGTNLFTYTIFSGAYSHSYSFCFMTLTYYTAYLFFNDRSKGIKWLLMTLLFSCVVLTIRPFNAILLLGVIYFYKPFALNEFSFKRETKWIPLILLLLIFAVVAYSADIIYDQTGSFVPDSYVGERFYFNRWDHVFDNFLGFQYGIFWYVPLIMICLATVFLSRRDPRILCLIIPVILTISLYSLWWYWSIVSRVIVDCSTPLAILLACLLVSLGKNKRAFRLVMISMLMSVPLFQLKAYQMRNGILDSNYTYAKYYFKYFFTTRHVNIFPVNPTTIIRQLGDFENFEGGSGFGISKENSFEGKQSSVLNTKNEFAGNKSYGVPAFLNKKGFKKVKAAFWMYKTKDLSNIHLVFKFTRKDSLLAYVPFYMNGQSSPLSGKWEYKEFGMDLPANVKPGDQLSIYFWNPEHRDEAFIDNLKVEFFLTDGSDEITLE